MSRRRVVVTGLGIVSPVGNTVSEAWANLVAGRTGIGPITKFDAAAFACRFAGEVKGFDVTEVISAKEARHMDTFIHYGLAASVQAVRITHSPIASIIPHSSAMGMNSMGETRPCPGCCQRSSASAAFTWALGAWILGW